jgi:hypothetical protein
MTGVYFRVRFYAVVSGTDVFLTVGPRGRTVLPDRIFVFPVRRHISCRKIWCFTPPFRVLVLAAG